MRAIGLLAVPVLAVSVHAEAPRQAPKTPPKQAAAAALAERATMLSPIQVESLTITPLVAKGQEVATQGPQIDVLTLDEAMAAKKVRIKEQTSETVNHLTMVNKSEQPLFLLAGEVIIGGKQDRIIGQNTVIPAKSTLVVPVFCVEQGRWDNSGKEFVSAKALAHGRLRGKASFESQGDVWREVAAKNAARKTSNSTQTYRKVAEQQQGAFRSWQKKVDDALANIPAADRERLIGYVVALNGKVATVDVFQSPALLKKLETKLVKSYVTEAVDIVAAKNIKPPTEADVKAFIADAEKAEERQSYDNARSTTMTKSGRYSGKSSVKMKPAKLRDSDPAPVVDSKTPSVYENYQAK